MRAAVHTRYGAPDVVGVEDVAEPVPAAGELLIRVRATTVNRTDCGMRAADPFVVRVFSGITRPRLRILGSEFAGDVQAVGEGVAGFAEGDAVFGLSSRRMGAHAEYVRLPASGPVARKPANVGYDEAAALCDGAMLALTALRKALVFDAVGKSSFRRCRRLLRRPGVFLFTDLGFLGHVPLLALLTRFVGRARVILPIPRHNQGDVEFLKGLVEAGSLRAVIDRRYPLEEIVEAYRYVETGQKTGNVVITVA